MRIDINSIDRENFIVTEGEFCGDKAVLVIPNHIGAKYTKQTLIFRSSIWRVLDGELVSASFQKFYNYLEQPDLYPNPENFNDKFIETKIDGSTAIFDYNNNILSIRTRGTFSYTTQDNYQDFEYIANKYPKIKEYLKLNPNITLLGEIVTPNNVIVIRPPEIDLFLIDCIDKTDYSYLSKSKLQEVAEFCGLKRPEIYSFNSLTDIINTVENWRGKEGVVVSYNNNKNKIKLKGKWYQNCHKIKSKLNTLDAIVDLFCNLGFPDYNSFYTQIEETFDFEIAQQLIGDISKISEAYKEVCKITAHMREFVEPLKLKTRKEAAIAIQRAYGTTNRCSFCFNFLDNRPLEVDNVKKLLFQVLKNS